jgi:hypothetical protein
MVRRSPTPTLPRREGVAQSASLLITALFAAPFLLAALPPQKDNKKLFFIMV